MGEGFTVESTDLVTAAGRVTATAGQVSGVTAPATAAAQPAAAANPGFLTSPALTEVCARFGQSAQELGRRMTAHAENLRANAQAYQDVERRNSDLFRRGG